MIKLHQKLFIGSDKYCQPGNKDLAVVHACKSPCHQRAVGYSGSLPNSHPNYLVKEDEFNLYLNIIDPPIPLFMPETFTAFMKFGKNHFENDRKVLIHCNQGESRAPSLALLFLAKHTQDIPNESYEAARKQFREIFPGYRPGRGIQTFLGENWEKLG
jgi:protein-tyrosine phosphatase